MDTEQGHGPEDEADAAERAFEALRDEVAALRRTLERLAGLVAQGRPDEPAPDYSPTLGAMAQELRAVGVRLDGIEAQPALRLTPGEITQQVAAGVRRASDEAVRGHAHAGTRLDDAVRDLRALIGAANSQLAQRRREWIAAAIGAVLGLALWYPLVWFTPFGGGNWLAASLIGGGEWRAGAALMREEAPESWERMVRLYNACGEQVTETCEVAMTVRATRPTPPQPAGKARQ